MTLTSTALAIIKIIWAILVIIWWCILTKYFRKLNCGYADKGLFYIHLLLLLIALLIPFNHSSKIGIYLLLVGLYGFFSTIVGIFTEKTYLASGKFFLNWNGILVLLGVSLLGL